LKCPPLDFREYWELCHRCNKDTVQVEEGWGWEPDEEHEKYREESGAVGAMIFMKCKKCGTVNSHG